MYSTPRTIYSELTPGIRQIASRISPQDLMPIATRRGNSCSYFVLVPFLDANWILLVEARWKGAILL